MTDSAFTIHCGDALEVLRTLPDESVNCCITSPPYYGLRDYGTAKWEGGRPDCDHKQETQHQKQGANSCAIGRAVFAEGANRNENYRGVCPFCGARRIDSQIGLERTPSEYIARLVDIFREVRRVLKSDGTLWVNIGDSYATGGGKANQPGGGYRGNHDADDKRPKWSDPYCQPNRLPLPGLKPKDLIGIPWMLAFALRDDGWWLRQDIVWAKPNPMPESVRDRCTKAHEYVFLLTKSARYFYDQDAVKQKCSDETHARYARGRSNNHKWADGGPGNQTIARTFEHMRAPGVGPKAADPGNGIKMNTSFAAATAGPVESRNLRSVWTIATQPTPEAHFATFPLELPEICLKAGCPQAGVVLDPFAGAGTTGLACLKNNRRFLGIELNPAYIEIARRRAEKYFPLLMGIPA